MPPLFRPSPTIPTIAAQKIAKGRPPGPVQAVCSAAGLAELAAVVRIVSVTVVVPAPAAIAAGLNPQLVNAGKPVHPKLTAELKAAPPAGTAENV